MGMVDLMSYYKVDNFLLRSKFPKKVNLKLTVVHLDIGDYADGYLPKNWLRN